MQETKKIRDSFFDNYKAFLILCVVIGHFLNHYTSDFKIAEILRVYIYFFHIPAFTFISGYFAKKNSFSNLVKKLLVPYIIFQTIYYFLYTGMGLDVDFSFLCPFFTLWYLLALFIWRLLIEPLSKFRYLLPISILCSVLVGFIPSSAVYDGFDLYRIVAFFPFFIMGHIFDRKKFDSLCQKASIKKWAIALMLCLFIFVSLEYQLFDVDILNCQTSYKELGVLCTGWLFRLIFIPFATCLIYAIGVLMPKKKNASTFLGKYTMRIYLCHGLIYKFLSLGTDALDLVNSFGDFFLYLLMVILLAFSLSLVPLEPILHFILILPNRIMYKMKQLYV